MTATPYHMNKEGPALLEEHTAVKTIFLAILDRPVNSLHHVSPAWKTVRKQKTIKIETSFPDRFGTSGPVLHSRTAEFKTHPFQTQALISKFRLV